MSISVNEDTLNSTSAVTVAGISFGPAEPVRVIAGPCSVESPEQFRATAEAVAEAGATLLRGGAFKPRTSPYSFQGLGLYGLQIMREVADDIGIGIVTEALAVEDVDLVAEFADMIQIGARNMDNQALLEVAAQSGKPILLKRGVTATVEEALIAAESIIAAGNDDVMICERGSRTLEPAVRNSLDISAVPEIRQRSNLPIVVDPSHGTGRTDLVTSVAMAGIAAGADGVIVEVHPNPAEALSDGYQSMEAKDFGDFMAFVRRMADAVGRGV